MSDHCDLDTSDWDGIISDFTLSTSFDDYITSTFSDDFGNTPNAETLPIGPPSLPAEGSGHFAHSWESQIANTALPLQLDEFDFFTTGFQGPPTFGDDAHHGLTVIPSPSD
ncbi:hypothetical protein SUNI508_04988 [Seiridium unicorne]|uniref:Uncharacterized protein n=1 Tax=Seiridium unicorne TaxID=138068 RepID=A0ABR2V6W7_9PEZI